MLKKVYWVKGTPTVVMAAAGFRSTDGTYEYGIEMWEKVGDQWVYQGRRVGSAPFEPQTPARQAQLEEHPEIRYMLQQSL